jgi:hypothetical protein
MKTQLKALGIALVLASADSYGVVCPVNENIPYCPSSGSTLLDETYPTQAFVVANSPGKGSIQSNKFTSRYIRAIAKSYDYKNLPQIIIPVYPHEFTTIIDGLKEDLKKDKIPADKIKTIISQVSHASASNYTWQQDYFEAFVDLKTGNPVLREFDSYIDKIGYLKGAMDEIQRQGESCKITAGKNFPDRTRSVKNPSILSGEMGGNIEGLPGGLCLTGKNLSIDTSADFCGKKENVVQVNVDWMIVGHVDEIFKIIPSQFTDGRPQECSFSLMAASPKKAMELMTTPAGKLRKFLELSEHLSKEELLEAKKTRSSAMDSSPGSLYFCTIIENALKNGTYKPQKTKVKLKTKTVFMDLMLSEAYAETFNCADHIDEVPNEILVNGLKDFKDIVNLNQAIQESIDKDKELIKKKILGKLPQCASYFDIVDVPDLFYGSPAIEKNGKFILPSPSDVASFLPNPTNAVLMNRTILLPESGNPVFDDYVTEELKKRKLATEKIDSWDYAHVTQGNVHCASHSILYCRPRSSK